MKRVKKSKTKEEISYAMKKVVWNSRDKIIEAVEKTTYKKVRDACQGTKKQSEKSGQNRKYPYTGFDRYYFFADKMCQNSEEWPDIEVANPPGAKAVNQSFYKHENNNGIDDFRT